MKNWQDFSGKKNYNNNNPSFPTSKPCGMTKASKTTMIVEVQITPRSAHYIEWATIPFVLQHWLPTRTQRKTLLQQSRRSRSSKTRTVNHFSRKKEKSPLGKEEEEHWIIIFWVLTLGCKIHLPFFRLPAPLAHTSCHFLSRLTPLLPTPQAPHRLCPAEGHCR